jgi:anti-sigma factor (TIGR02949 family)
MPNRSDCETVVRQLWPYLDGVVAGDTRDFISAHLEICAACASHFDFARAFLEAVSAARSHMPVSEALRARVMGALAADGFSSG